MKTILYRRAAHLLPHIPQWLIYSCCEALAAVVFGLVRSVRRGILANQLRVQPTLRLWQRWLQGQRTLAYVLRHYTDMLRLPTWSEAQLAGRFEITGTEHMDTLLARGKGGMMAVPHCGSFSTVLAELARRGYPLVLVVESIEPPELLELMTSLRQQHGLEVLSLSPTAGRDVLRAIRANKIVVLAGDRDLASQHLRLPFFGEPTSVPIGLARLAIRGVPLVTAFTAWLDNTHSIARIDPLHDLTQRSGESTDAAIERAASTILSRLERYIAAFPASWGVLQPVWTPATPKEDRF